MDYPMLVFVPGGGMSFAMLLMVPAIAITAYYLTVHKIGQPYVSALAGLRATDSHTRHNEYLRKQRASYVPVWQRKPGVLLPNFYFGYAKERLYDAAQAHRQ